MSTTAKPFGLQGAAHTAGIFADHSVDGPIIGTLVAVVDRAKNLPNRKTIGKQDPYCAARLGKEAKKTATDIRGGQTPKWDQELRFTVHDSSDYYQLKVSVFTDDKRTDLIGETWIDLKGIIIAGGGQSDVWQSLACKGKYAGEIRLEITFYDSRPKPERPTAARPKPQHADSDVGASRQRGGAKRRPLPSDPVTGEAPPMAAAVTASTPGFYAQQQTPPRQHTKRPSHSGLIPNQSPLQSVEHNAAASRPQPNDPYYTTPTRRVEREQSQDWDQYEPPSYDQPSQRHYSPAERHELPSRGSPRNLPPIETAQPPPPPAHRSRQSSVGPDMNSRGSHETSPQKQNAQSNMRHGVLRNEAHRYTNSASNVPYQTYQAPPTANSASPNSPRHHERSASHDPYARNGYGGDEMHFEREPSPGPYGRSPGHMASSPRHYGSSRYEDHDDYQNAPSPAASREYGNSPGHAPPEQHRRQASYRDEYDASSRGHSPGYSVPPPPSSLSYNIDPRLSRDVADRINDERRYDERFHQQTAAGRGRQYSEPPPSYGGRRDASPQPMQQSDRRSTANYDAPDPHTEQRRRMSASPNPAHRIPRKSVSPAPSLVVVERRRLSDVPFGPDSYDALNPSVVSSARSDYSATSGLEHRQPNGKIIAHNGQEVDPSDHLPETSWAPEPEPRPGSKQPSPEPARTRQSLSGAQPMPQAQRNRDRRSTRPEVNDSQQSYGYQYNEPTTPTTTGRTRLQKKARGSSVSPGAVPLAPIAPEQYHDNRYGGYSPSREPARGHYDYPNENYAPQYGHGPPVPAKVPLHPSEHSSLEDEMSRIDIGNGRSRRRGGY